MALVTVQRSPSPSNEHESDGDTASENISEDVDDGGSPLRQRRFSQNYFAVKGAAVILPQSECKRRIPKIQYHEGGDIQEHLQSMFYLLRQEDTIKVAVKLESSHPHRNRYMVVVSCIGRQDTEECVILGIDVAEKPTIGLVFPIWTMTQIRLDGDGGFIVSLKDTYHIFKPISVQAMWSAYLSLNKVCSYAQTHAYYPGGLTHTWVGYYESNVASDRSCIQEWQYRDDLWATQNVTIPEPLCTPTESGEALHMKLKTELRAILMTVDLDEVTSLYLRERLEDSLGMSLREHRRYIDEELIIILRQMETSSEIFEFLYLGSEWNASNLAELQQNGITHILNVTREIDNFYPFTFEYDNIREFDEEATDLMKYWNRTHKFIKKARDSGSKCLVHCKMGVSRSAATVIAFAMKEYGWSLEKSLEYVKLKRHVIRPNESFMKQLETYQGILDASRQRHNSIWRSKSETNLVSLSLMHQQEESCHIEDAPDSLTNFTQDDLELLVKANQHPWQAHEDNLPSNIQDDTIDVNVELSSRSADSIEDVFPPENPSSSSPDNRHDLTNVSLTPHTGSTISTENTSTNSEATSEDSATTSSASSKCTFGFYEILENNISPARSPNTKHKHDEEIKKRNSLSSMYTNLESAENEDKGRYMTPPNTPISDQNNADPQTPSSPSPEEIMVGLNKTLHLEESTILQPDTDSSCVMVSEVEHMECDVHAIQANVVDSTEETNSSEAFNKAKDMTAFDGNDMFDNLQDVTMNVSPTEATPTHTLHKSDTLDTDDSKTLVDDKAVTMDNCSSTNINQSDVLTSTCDPVSNTAAIISDKEMTLQDNAEYDPSSITSKEPSNSVLSDDVSQSSLSRSPSVYEAEDILLVPGIVRKTKMEIEERNRDSNDKSALTRSSSLKVVNQRKTTPIRRGDERRRTCAIMTRRHISPSKDYNKDVNADIYSIPSFTLSNSPLIVKKQIELTTRTQSTSSATVSSNEDLWPSATSISTESSDPFDLPASVNHDITGNDVTMSKEIEEASEHLFTLGADDIPVVVGKVKKHTMDYEEMETCVKNPLNIKIDQCLPIDDEAVRSPPMDRETLKIIRHIGRKLLNSPQNQNVDEESQLKSGIVKSITKRIEDKYGHRNDRKRTADKQITATIDSKEQEHHEPLLQKSLDTACRTKSESDDSSMSLPKVKRLVGKFGGSVSPLTSPTKGLTVELIEATPDSANLDQKETTTPIQDTSNNQKHDWIPQPRPNRGRSHHGKSHPLTRLKEGSHYYNTL